MSPGRDSFGLSTLGSGTGSCRDQFGKRLVVDAADREFREIILCTGRTDLFFQLDNFAMDIVYAAHQGCICSLVDPFVIVVAVLAVSIDQSIHDSRGQFRIACCEENRNDQAAGVVRNTKMLCNTIHNHLANHVGSQISPLLASGGIQVGKLISEPLTNRIQGLSKIANWLSPGIKLGILVQVKSVDDLLQQSP